MAMKLTSIVLLSANLLATANGRALRNQDTHDASGVMSADAVKKTLLEEIENNFASVGKRGRLASLEVDLKPLFDTLPKNEHGNLGHSPVRYALAMPWVVHQGLGT